MKRNAIWGALAAFVLSWGVGSDASASGVYRLKNVDLTGGFARVERSGTPFFADSFEKDGVWVDFRDYNGSLDVGIVRESGGESVLRVARERSNPDDPEDGETAWNASSDCFPVPEDAAGREFVLRIAARSSKAIAASADDGTWAGTAVLWFDAGGESCGESPFLFDVGLDAPGFGEKSFVGRIPENAASFELRVGFDQPNLVVGDSVEIDSVSLEAVDDADAPFGAPGEFVSGVLPGGGPFSWAADVPDGCAVRFQLATGAAASALFDVPTFVGPDGTGETFFDAPLGVDAPFVRYRAVLVPNAAGIATPTLKSVSIGPLTDSRWFIGGDFQPPRVEIVGDRAAPTRNPRAPLTLAVSDDSAIRWDSLKIEIDGVDRTARFVRAGGVRTGGKIELGTGLAGLGLNGKGGGTGGGRSVWAVEPGEPVDAINGVPFAELPPAPRVPAAELTFAPDADWAPGLRRVRVEISDVAGNSVSASRAFLVGDVPETPRATLRADGTTLIDGEPFFPIGIYGVAREERNGFDFDAAFAELRDAGFNFAQSYGEGRTEEFLAAAEKFGFKLWVGADEPDERFLERERFSPAILAWYVGDDTSLNATYSELCDRRQPVVAADSTRLSVQADVVAGREFSNYFLYAPGTDAFLPEIYPIRRDEPKFADACVAQALRDVETARRDAALADDGPKAIWPILQSFKGWGWERFPTFAELRGTSFAALVAGGNGIVWFVYGARVEPERKLDNFGCCATPETWANLTTVVRQIRALESFWLAPTDPAIQPTATVVDGPTENPLGGPPIACLLKRIDGETTLVVVDACPTPVEVRIDCGAATDEAGDPNARSGDRPVDVLFDESAEPTALRDGVLTVRLEGLGVGVYRWK